MGGRYGVAARIGGASRSWQRGAARDGAHGGCRWRDRRGAGCDAGTGQGETATPKSLWFGVRFRKPAGSRPPFWPMLRAASGRAWLAVRARGRFALSRPGISAGRWRPWAARGADSPLPVAMKISYKEQLRRDLRFFSHMRQNCNPCCPCNLLELHGPFFYFRQGRFSDERLAQGKPPRQSDAPCPGQVRPTSRGGVPGLRRSRQAGPQPVGRAGLALGSGQPEHADSLAGRDDGAEQPGQV